MDGLKISYFINTNS